MGKARRHRVYAAAGRALLCAALLHAAGCVGPPEELDIPPSLEATGILFIEVTRYEAGLAVVRRITIDSRTYAVRCDLRTGEEGEFGPISLVPKDRMSAIWSAAAEIVRSSPEPIETQVRDKLVSTNALGICVMGGQRPGGYGVLWPLGTQPADPKVRKLVNLVRQVDRSDARTRFSQFGNGG